MYKSTDGEFHNVNINKMLELKYNPSDLRALHYQISCGNMEMIEVREKVTIALANSEKFLLEAFLKHNSEFQIIQAEEETEEH